MPCPKELAAGTGTTPYPHTKTPNINTTHNQAKPLGRHHLPVHWQRPTAASRRSELVGLHTCRAACATRCQPVKVVEPVCSLTMRTTALMAVISSSRWACLPAEQQQQEQLPLRLDASRDTTPHL